MTTPPPPPDIAGEVGAIIDSLFVPVRGTRVQRASQVSRRTRQREIVSYQQAYPQATRQQAASRTASLRRRGYIPRTIRREQATPEQAASAEQYQQRSERARQAFAARFQPRPRDYDPGQVAQVIYNKIAESYARQNEPLLRELEAQGVIQPGDHVVLSGTFEFNMQAVIWNMSHAIPAERVWAVETATGSQLRHRATDDNRQSVDSVWFYHGDLVRNGI